MSEIGLYYKNVSADVIGKEHGISKSQFDELARQVKPAIAEVNKQRKEGKIPYRDLPYNKEYLESVKQVAADIEGKFENSAVLCPCIRKLNGMNPWFRSCYEVSVLWSS